MNPKHRMEIGGTDEDSVCELVEFAIAMRQKLQEVNKDAFNTFQLRVGISSGPVVSGVIGARKPIFDIWGNSGESNISMSNDCTDNKKKIPQSMSRHEWIRPVRTGRFKYLNRQPIC